MNLNLVIDRQCGRTKNSIVKRFEDNLNRIIPILDHIRLLGTQGQLISNVRS